jgi:hypothetical protein
MRLWALLVGLAACTPAQERRPVDAQALHGVTLGVPVPADVRDTPGIGCGQLAPNLALRAHKALVASFSDAGANATNASTGRWVLTVALRDATMGPANERARLTDRPLSAGNSQPDQPPLAQPQQPLFNSGQGAVAVVLEATLARDGTVVWRDTVTGHAQSAPCVQAIDKVHEALQDAVDALRARVLPVLRATGP